MYSSWCHKHHSHRVHPLECIAVELSETLARQNSFKRLAVIATSRTEGTMEVLIERQRGEQNGHWTRALARANEDLGGGEEGGIDLARVS